MWKLSLLVPFVFGACATASTTASTTVPRDPAQMAAAVTRWDLMSMGTLWEIEWSGPAPKPGTRATLDRILKTYEATFSDWVDDSELRRHERAGLTKLEGPSPLFREGLLWAEESCRLSRGAFDVTIGAVIWKLTAKPVGCSALKLVGGEPHFGVDPKRLSFGGLVKGAAVAALAAELHALGARDLRINAGNGNAIVAGRYALAEKLDSGFYLVSHSYSGTNKRAHILDPRTGLAVKPGGASARCSLDGVPLPEWPRIGALSDALSTTAVVTPAEARSLDFGIASCKVYEQR